MTEMQTSWTLIQAAARGDDAARTEFARRYLPMARIYLSARWSRSNCLDRLEDALQDLFLECVKSGGVLARLASAGTHDFRIYFLGVVRNVARRYEAKARPMEALPQEPLDPGTSPSVRFDRAWAKGMMREARELQKALAANQGERAVRRVELLRLRFEEGLPIRKIAELWQTDAAELHHEYATARKEFMAALHQVLVSYQPQATMKEIETACRNLLELLKS
jgi:DNA-directed RNA polymerase specialized sigma24 family protein